MRKKKDLTRSHDLVCRGNDLLSRGNELFVILPEVFLNAVHAPAKVHAKEEKLTRVNDLLTRGDELVSRGKELQHTRSHDLPTRSRENELQLVTTS